MVLLGTLYPLIGGRWTPGAFQWDRPLLRLHVSAAGGAAGAADSLRSLPQMAPGRLARGPGRLKVAFYPMPLPCCWAWPWRPRDRCRGRLPRHRRRAVGGAGHRSVRLDALAHRTGRRRYARDGRHDPSPTGFAVFLMGVLTNRSDGRGKDLRFAPGQSVTIAGLDFRFRASSARRVRTGSPTRAPWSCPGTTA